MKERSTSSWVPTVNECQRTREECLEHLLPGTACIFLHNPSSFRTEAIILAGATAHEGYAINRIPRVAGRRKAAQLLSQSLTA